MEKVFSILGINLFSCKKSTCYQSLLEFFPHRFAQSMIQYYKICPLSISDAANLIAPSREVSITNGKWADFVILDQRLSDPVGKELKETLVTSTFFAGKEVYTKN